MCWEDWSRQRPVPGEQRAVQMTFLVPPARVSCLPTVGPHPAQALRPALSCRQALRSLSLGCPLGGEGRGGAAIVQAPASEQRGHSGVGVGFPPPETQGPEPPATTGSPSTFPVLAPPALGRTLSDRVPHSKVAPVSQMGAPRSSPCRGVATGHPGPWRCADHLKASPWRGCAARGRGRGTWGPQQGARTGCPTSLRAGGRRAVLGPGPPSSPSGSPQVPLCPPKTRPAPLQGAPAQHTSKTCSLEPGHPQASFTDNLFLYFGHTEQLVGS